MIHTIVYAEQVFVIKKYPLVTKRFFFLAKRWELSNLEPDLIYHLMIRMNTVYQTVAQEHFY